MSRVIRCANRAEWLAARRIGASDVAKVIGLPGEPYTYGGPWDVWARLTGQAPIVDDYDDLEWDHPRRRGHEWEPVVLYLYNRKTGNPTRRPPDFTLWYGDDEWSSSTPDAFATDRMGLGLAQLKTDQNPRAYGEEQVIERWTPDLVHVVRRRQALQCYTELHTVPEAQFNDLTVLLPEYDLRVYRFLRDPQIDEALDDTLAPWWDRCVRRGERPDLDGSAACREWLADRFPERTPARPGTAEQLELATRAKAISQAVKELEAEKALLNSQLIAEMADASGLTWRTGRKTVRATLVQSKGQPRFERKRLEADRPDLVEVLDQYTTRSPYAYVRLSGFKET